MEKNKDIVGLKKRTSYKISYSEIVSIVMTLAHRMYTHYIWPSGYFINWCCWAEKSSQPVSICICVIEFARSLPSKSTPNKRPSKRVLYVNERSWTNQTFSVCKKSIFNCSSNWHNDTVFYKIPPLEYKKCGLPMIHVSSTIAVN